MDASFGIEDVLGESDGALRSAAPQPLSPLQLMSWELHMFEERRRRRREREVEEEEREHMQRMRMLAQVRIPRKFV